MLSSGECRRGFAPKTGTTRKDLYYSWKQEGVKRQKQEQLHSKMASGTRISGTTILPPAVVSAWPQIDLYLEVFTTSTILEKIEALLDLDDLKTLRLVNKAFNRIVFEKLHFIEKANVVLSLSNFLDPAFSSVTWKPKNLEIIPFFFATSPQNWFSLEMIGIICKTYMFVTDIHSLRIHPSDSYEYEQTVDMEEKYQVITDRTYSSSVVNLSCPCLPTLLRQANRLEHLQISSYSLSELREGPRQPSKSLRLKTLKIFLESDLDFFPKMLENTIGLERIGIERSTPTAKIGAEFWPNFIKMIENNRETIQQLDGLTPGFWTALLTPPTGMELKLPKLKFISVLNTHELSGEIRNKLIAFLGSYLPQLEGLNLREGSVGNYKWAINSVPTSNCLEVEILYVDSSVIQAFQILKQANVSDVTIGPFTVQPDSSVQEPDADQLLLTNCNPETLEKLSLEGNARNENAILVSVVDPRGLKNFTSLTTLKLIHLQVFKESYVTSICENLLQLKHLTIEHVFKKPDVYKGEVLGFNRLTDAAFLDENRHEEMDSNGCLTLGPPIPALRMLQNLEYLRLWELDVTLNTLIYGIRFKNLRTLNFDKEFDTGITLTVLRNNPCLDLIKCDEANVDMEEILALFPNFKNIIGDFGCGCCDE